MPFFGNVGIVRGDSVWDGQGLDISDGGVLVECAGIGLRIGDEVAIDLSPAAGAAMVRLRARLVRRSKGRDYAFQFVAAAERRAVAKLAGELSAEAVTVQVAAGRES